MNYTITPNAAYNSLEISFDGKPAEAVRDALKALKFRWHNVKKVWYGYADEATARSAIDDAEKPLEIPASKFVDGGGLYDGWEGGNNRKWNSEKELKSFLLSDFKKSGIPASVRFNRSGYLTSITVTIKISASDVKPFDEWREENKLRVFNGSFPWISYTDESGKYCDILKETALYMKGDEGDKMRENILRTTYKISVAHLTESGTCHNSNEDVLTDDANKRFETVRAIVGSYNRDCSNSMVDYFDRDIYDNYTFKIS